MEEEIASNIDKVMMEGGSHDLNNTGSDIDSVDHIYDIGAMTSQKIGSFNFFSIPSSNVSKSKATIQDVPQSKKLQFKRSHSTVSP